MLNFKRVFYKNMQSAGEQGITIDLDRHSTTLVGGDNGSGKSNLLESIVYALFGKTMKKLNLGNLINSVNKKGMLTVVQFEKNGKLYTVKRGQKPKVFEIWEDDKQLDKDATAADQQKKLESIMGFDYKLFIQLVVLNTERYVPFMELSAPDRRHVVEGILDIGVFAQMNKIAKENARNVSLEIDDLSYKRDIHKEKVAGQHRLIEQAEKANEDRGDEINGLIGEWEDKKESLEKERDLTVSLIRDMGEKKEEPKLDDLNSQLTTLANDAQRIQKDVKFFKVNDDCPTCGSTIEEDLKNSQIDNGEKEINVLRDRAREVAREKKQREAEITEAKEHNKKLTDMANHYREYVRRIKECEDEIAKLVKQRDNKPEDKTKEHKATLVKYEIELADFERELDTLYDQKSVYDQAMLALKDDGIKAGIVGDYIDYINVKVSEYLQAMGFYINIVLDQNFNEEVNSINRENFTYDNFSKGQRCRINLAIWLALLEVASVKNSTVTNILFLDEILENLDADGVQLFMKLLDEKMPHRNVFVVTQRFDEFKDYFKSDIRFRLDGPFTVMDQ